MIVVVYSILMLLAPLFGVQSIVLAQERTATSSLPNKKGVSSLKALNKPEMLELKAKLEQAIAKNYKDRISTQIDTSLFSVSVQVSLMERPEEPKKDSTPPNPNESVETKPSNQNPSTIPADINLGNIPINLDLEKLKQEMRNNESGRQALNDLLLDSWMSRVQITKVEVYIGLDSELDKDYRKTFSNWLSKVISAEFGATGAFKVFEIKKIVKVEPPKEPITIYDQLSKFQVTLGFVIFSLITLLIVLLNHFTTSKDTREKNRTAILIQEMQVAQINTASLNKNLIAEKNEKSGKELQNKSNQNEISHSQLDVIARSFKDLQIKVGFLLETGSMETTEIVESWFAQGWQGRIKFAALLDSLLSYESSLSAKDIKNFKSSSISSSLLEWIKGRANSSDKSLFEAFQEFPNITIQDRYQILEQCYWDLLSIRMMGKQILKTRFTILQELPNEKIHEVLSKQDQKLKALAILHLPQDKIQDLMTVMSTEEKQKLINDSLKMTSLHVSDVELADEALKFAINKENEVKEDEFSVESLIPNLLASLTVLDEFKMLPNAILQLKDQGQYIKKNIPSLVFMPEWPDEYIRLFFSQVETKFIVSYLLVAPQMQERVLKLIPTRSAVIVADEFKNAKLKASDDHEKNLNYLKLRLYKLINDGELSLAKIFKPQSINEAKPRRVA